MSGRWHDDVDRHIAEQPDARAVIEAEGVSWDYAALDRAIDDVQTCLSNAGVVPGDRVLLIIENCAAAVASLFACSRLGAWAIPVNARLTAIEVDRIMDHARPRLVLCTAQVSPDAAAHATRLNSVEVEGAFGTLQMATPFPSDPDSDREVAVILYTTGTTGLPKGVMLTHANMLFSGRSAAAFRGLTPSGLVYGVGPMTHVMGLCSMMSATLCVGACVWLESRFSAERLYDALRQGVTHLPAVPQLHALLMQYVREKGIETLSSLSLEYVSSGGAPLDPAWKRKAEAFYGLPLQNGYGMTETTSAASITYSKIGDPDVSVGPALKQVDLAIDQSVPGGGNGTGEVLVRGPNIMKGYYRSPEETAKVLGPDGWMRTGDLGRIDDHGNLHIQGRTKELIIHGGFNVYPPEVEAALNDHPQVIQCAVVGRVVGGDEKVVAFVQAAPDDMPNVEDLRVFAAQRLAGYKRPSQIIVSTELPAAPTGKILKHKLLGFFEDQLD